MADDPTKTDPADPASSMDPAELASYQREGISVLRSSEKSAADVTAWAKRITVDLVDGHGCTPLDVVEYAEALLVFSYFRMVMMAYPNTAAMFNNKATADARIGQLPALLGLLVGDVAKAN